MSGPAPHHRPEAAGEAQEASAGLVVVCLPGESADAAVRRVCGSAPPPFLIVLPSNGRECPEPPPPQPMENEA
jgi:hypothetical protein